MALVTRLYTNNARTTLAGSLTPTGLTITLQTGAGALFPSPNSLNDEFFELTLQDAATGLRTEIVAITARTGDILTVDASGRGRQGTSAQSWASGDAAFLSVTAGSLEDVVKATNIQYSAFNSADATGTANAITATFSPAIASLGDGLTLYVKASAANTITTPTFAPDGLTAKTIQKVNAQALRLGDIAGAGHIMILKYDLASDKWLLLNPATSAPINSAQLDHVTYYDITSSSYTDVTGFSQAITITNAPAKLRVSASIVASFQSAALPVYFKLSINGGEYSNTEIKTVTADGNATDILTYVVPIEAIISVAQNTTYTVKLQVKNSTGNPTQNARINASHDYPTSRDPNISSTLVLHTV